jgi:hypothetical protein
MRRVVLAALLVAAAGLLWNSEPAHAANAPVGILFSAFETGTCPDPAGDSTTTIQVGDTVTWTSCSGAPHNVTADNNAFPTKSFQSDLDFASQQFVAPGTYGYKCTIHNFPGTVIVEGSAATTTTTATTTPATTTTRPTTTTSTSVPATTTTVDDFGGVFDNEPTSSTSSTVFDPSAPTTRALGSGGGSGTSAGTVALLLVGLIGVGTGVALLMRRLRGPALPS